MRNQARQRVNIILTIIENRCTLLGGERWALQNPLTHIAFVGGVDAIFAEVLQGSGESEKALVAVRTLRGAVVHAVAKLNVGIERARRLPPAEVDVAAKLGADHIADEERVRVEPIGRKPAELVLPQTHELAGAHFEGDEAERRDRVTLSAAVSQTRSGIIFEIDAPNFPERQRAPLTDRRRHRHRPPLASACRRAPCRWGAICRG